MKLTEHFDLEEFTRSSTALRLGIDQTPSPVVFGVLSHTAAQMEKIRAILSASVRISSGYRSPDLNRAVGSGPKSQHLTGHAVDFTCPDFGDPKKIVKYLSECPLVQFDQLIYEGTWVHISFTDKPRREVLTAHFSPAGTTYTQGVS